MAIMEFGLIAADDSLFARRTRGRQGDREGGRFRDRRLLDHLVLSGFKQSVKGFWHG